MSNIYYAAILAEQRLANEYAQTLSHEKNISIVLSTSQPSAVLSYIDTQKPHSDKITVVYDVFKDEADMDFIHKAKAKGIPVLAVVSSVKYGFSLMAEGAANMMVRKESDTEQGLFFYKMLLQHIEKINADYWQHSFGPEEPQKVKDKVVAIGASTGGTETLLQILKQLPADGPPVLVAQHMPAVFTKLYAERADSLCPMHITEGRHGDIVSNGRVLIAPGDYHMRLVKEGGVYRVHCSQGERVHGQRPSVDVLFNSVASAARGDAVGVILTGMGADGASGLLNMRNNGAYTIGQDESTSVIYGMPRAAYEMGAVITQLPLEKICDEIRAKAVK